MFMLVLWVIAFYECVQPKQKEIIENKTTSNEEDKINTLQTDSFIIDKNVH